MSERKITIEDGRSVVGACGMLIFAIAIATFLFQGDPDVHDLVKRALSAAGTFGACR